jgi:hypothetical protein
MATENNSAVSPLPPEPENTSRESPPSPSVNSDSQQKGWAKLRRIVSTDMKLKDWITLLLIPIVLSATGVLLNSYGKTQDQLASQQQAIQQQQFSIEAALDQQRETTLQTYINTIQDYMLNHHLEEPPDRNVTTNDPIIEVRELARARTLIVLKGLDPERKGLLVQFLYGANLIQVPLPIIFPGGADLSYADLSGADLHEAYLQGTILIHANLSNADLYSAMIGNANLSNANLQGARLDDANLSGDRLIHANLRGANLFYTDLQDVNLQGADLSGADLSYADLQSVDPEGTIITQQQLDQVYSCKRATLPKGLTCHKTP